jgi:hypothetical protein
MYTSSRSNAGCNGGVVINLPTGYTIARRTHLLLPWVSVTFSYGFKQAKVPSPTRLYFQTCSSRHLLSLNRNPKYFRVSLPATPLNPFRGNIFHCGSSGNGAADHIVSQHGLSDVTQESRPKGAQSKLGLLPTKAYNVTRPLCGTHHETCEGRLQLRHHRSHPASPLPP